MSKQPKRPELCNGCYASYNNITALACELNPIMFDEQCPCITCLVKAMCTSSDDECKLYYDFASLD